jgi:hypothetical protein
MELFENNLKLVLDNLSSQIYLIDQHYNIMDCNSDPSLKMWTLS